MNPLTPTSRLIYEKLCRKYRRRLRGGVPEKDASVIKNLDKIAQEANLSENEMTSCVTELRDGNLIDVIWWADDIAAIVHLTDEFL